MDNDTFLRLIRDRAKKANAFLAEVHKESGRQHSVLNGTRLTLIAASAVSGIALGVTLGLATERL